MLNSRLKAGVLPTVLFISFIFAVLSAALILFVYSQRLLFVKQKVTHELNLNAQSALNFALANPALPFYQNYRFDLYDKGNDSVQITKKYWGLFDLIVSSAKRGRNKCQEIALIGSKVDSISTASLYLLDESRPLSLVGNTEIKGKAFLPKAGVKAAFIQPDFYKGKELIYGQILQSSDQLPEIKKFFFDRVEFYQNRRWTRIVNEFVQQLALPDEPISHSFSHPTLVVFKQGEIVLKNILVKGNVIIQSGKSIVVEKTATLENIIIIAPKVILKPEFKGQIQIFAADTVEVGERSQLDYPSAISVSSNSGAYVNLKSDSRVNGLITIVKEKDPKNQRVDISKLNRLNIEKGVIVHGSIYNEGYIQLKGSILGNIVCQRFYLQTPITLYENYLYDAIINVKQRSKHFLTSSLLSDVSHYDVIKWLK